MILLPSQIQSLQLPEGVDDTLFPEVSMESPDTSKGEDVNSPRRIAARAAIEKLEQLSREKSDGNTVDVSVSTEFSDKHEVFGAHMATRSVAVPAGGVVVGAVHKYPTLNVLMKGRVLMVSEHGKRMLVAPCMYMQEANTKKAGWVLEDCILTNVMLAPESFEDPELADNAIRDFHTTPSYNEVGMLTSTEPSRIEV